MGKNSIESDLPIANGMKSKITTTVLSLGTGSIEKAAETNIAGVQANAEMFAQCAASLQAYKAQLDADAGHIRELGLQFHNLDIRLASKMSR